MIQGYAGVYIRFETWVDKLIDKGYYLQHLKSLAPDTPRKYELVLGKENVMWRGFGATPTEALKNALNRMNEGVTYYDGRPEQEARKSLDEKMKKWGWEL